MRLRLSLCGATGVLELTEHKGSPACRAGTFDSIVARINALNEAFFAVNMPAGNSNGVFGIFETDCAGRPSGRHDKRRME